MENAISTGVMDALGEPWDDDLVKKYDEGGVFVPQWRYIQRLNDEVGGGWAVRVTDVRVLDVTNRKEGRPQNQLLVTVALTINGITRENFGTEDVDKLSWGGAATAAYSQAFKRACSMFGLGLDLYDKDKHGGFMGDGYGDREATRKQTDYLGDLASKALDRGIIDRKTHDDVVSLTSMERVSKGIEYLKGELDGASESSSGVGDQSDGLPY